MSEQNAKTNMENKVYVIGRAENIPEEEYRRYLNPMKTRRYGRLLKRALATALKVIGETGVEHPDAIINGTALGCLEETKYLLNGLALEGEEVSMPTHFMQSTHNTVASLIGIYTHTHGYNCTYSHRKISFECAMQDAFMQMKSGKIKTALVCANDEITPGVKNIFNALGLGKDALSGTSAPAVGVAADRSVAVMLSSEPGEHPLAEVKAVEIRHEVGKEDTAEIKYAAL